MEEKRASLKRPHYFTGQLLDEQDFRAEQGYHLEGRRRHARTLHTSGLAGLEVTRQGSRNLQIGPGLAVDKYGREIVVHEPLTLTFSDPVPNSVAYVTIEYAEATEPADRSGDQATGDARTTEYALVRIGSTPPAADGSALQMARLPVDEKGNLGEPDLSVRTLAGTRIAAESVGTAELAPAAVTRDKLDPGLRGGWVRLPFKPSPFVDPSNAREFVIGVTRTFCDELGAKGTLAIPVPPGAQRLKEVVLAGPMNQAGIEIVIYRCGWDTTNNSREETPSPTMQIPQSAGAFQKNVQLNWSLNLQSHAVALFVHAKGRAEISLVAADFE